MDTWQENQEQIEEIHSPSRYRAGEYECIEVAGAVLEANNLTGIPAICTFNGLKYWWRWKQKTPRASLLKTIEYATKLLKYIDEHPEEFGEG